MPPIKSTKYIPSKVKSNPSHSQNTMPIINTPSVTCYEPYIGCANKPTFSVEVSYCYTEKSPYTEFEEEKYHSRIIISVPCNSPKEAVDCAMSTWEDKAKTEKNIGAMFDVFYDFRFISIVRVSVQIKNDYWE